MKRLIVVIALLIASHSQAEEKKMTPGVKKAIVGGAYAVCQQTDRLYDMSGSQEYYDKLRKCEAELEQYIKDATGGDEETFNALVEKVTEDGDRQQRQFNKRYEMKLDFAMKRAAMKK